MSSDITHSKWFKNVYDLDLDKFNLAKSSNSKVGQEEISKTAQAVIHYLQSPNQEIDEDAISGFISKVDKINKQFKEENLGTPFATSLVALHTLFNLRQQLPQSQQAVIQHPFVVKLSNLSNKEEINDKVSIATELHQFLKTCLNPALLAVQNENELNAFESIVKECLNLVKALQTVDVSGALAKQKKEMIQNWKLKSFQMGVFYQKIVSYQVGGIPRLDKAEKRKKITQALTDQLQKFYGFVELGLILPKEQIAFYKGVVELQKEFEQYNDGGKLDPLLKELREKCKISEPSAPQKKPVQKQESSKGQETEEENVFKKWRERETQTTPVREKKEKPEVKKTSTSRVPSAQGKKERIIEDIQLKIAKLDLGDPRLKESAREIIENLDKLKPLLDPSSDISWIEMALILLIDPKALSISDAEQRFIQLLGEKYKLTMRELDAYSQFKNSSIQNAQLSLIKALKKGAPRFETLNDVCQAAAEHLPAQVVENRLKSFASNNSLKTIVTPLFANHFMYMVNAFRIFSEKIIHQEFEDAWQEMLKKYDSQTQGRFSKLLGRYSYLDPRRQFEASKELYQKYLVDSLDFAAMGKLEEQELASYLKANLEAFKQLPGQYFSDTYKHLYLEKHHWLLQNMTRIKRAYNQGDQDNTNLGEGVCYNNSLFRWTQIAQDPLIPNKSILLGSNDKTRFNQNKDKRFYEAYKKNTIPAQEVEQKRKDIAASYGLKPPLITPIPAPSSKQTLHDALVEAMGQWSQAGHKQLLVVLRQPSGTGHALNVRFDKDNGVYSLIDDNIGLVEFNSLEELKKQLSTYFKLFYSEYTSYAFETF